MFARCSFFLSASLFNSLQLSLRNINSKVLFRKALDDFYLQFLIVVLNFFFNLVYVCFLYIIVYSYLLDFLFSQQDPVDNSTWY